MTIAGDTGRSGMPGTRGGRAESRMLCRMERLGLLPLDLMALPVWQDLTSVRLAERAPVRLALVQAWDKRDQAPLYWSRVQRQAMDTARQAPRGKGDGAMVRTRVSKAGKRGGTRAGPQSVLVGAGQRQKLRVMNAERYKVLSIMKKLLRLPECTPRAPWRS